jgi:hypothetical protein
VNCAVRDGLWKCSILERLQLYIKLFVSIPAALFQKCNRLTFPTSPMPQSTPFTTPSRRYPFLPQRPSTGILRLGNRMNTVTLPHSLSQRTLPSLPPLHPPMWRKTAPIIPTGPIHWLACVLSTIPLRPPFPVLLLHHQSPSPSREG